MKRTDIILFVPCSDTSVPAVQMQYWSFLKYIKYVYMSIYVLYESEKGHFTCTTELDKP